MPTGPHPSVTMFAVANSRTVTQLVKLPSSSTTTSLTMEDTDACIRATVAALDRNKTLTSTPILFDIADGIARGEVVIPTMDITDAYIQHTVSAYIPLPTPSPILRGTTAPPVLTPATQPANGRDAAGEEERETSVTLHSPRAVAPNRSPEWLEPLSKQ